MATASTKKSSAGKNVLVFFIVFIILEALIIFGVSKVFKNKDVTPSLAGYSLYMTHTDLLKETEDGSYQVAVPKNVLVIASNGLNDAKNKIGSAVLCEKVKGEGSGLYWLVSVKQKDGHAEYTVSNGNNYYYLKSSNIVGVTTSYYKTAGLVIGFITSKFGMICCAVVPLFLLVLIELIIAIASHSSDDYDDYDDDEEDEKPRNEIKNLDDFLFGGEKDDEQIAKHRRQAAEAMKEAEDDDIQVFENKRRDDDFDIDLSKKPKVNTEDTVRPAEVPPVQSTNIDPYYEKAAKLVDGDNSANTAPVDNVGVNTDNYDNTAPVNDTPVNTRPVVNEAAPAQQETAAPANNQRRRRRRPVTLDTSNKSLEELMKLMEEEQEKLNKQIK